MSKLVALWGKLPPVVRSTLTRAVRTFVGTFVAVLTASGLGATHLVNWSLLQKAAGSAIAAAGAVVLAAFGSLFGDPNTVKFDGKFLASHRGPKPVQALGRLLQHDAASLAYDVEHVLSGKPLPAAVRHFRHAPPFDQGQLGSCTGNAIAGALMTGPLYNGTIYTEADAVGFYSKATHLDRVKGVYPPVDTGSSGLAVCKAAKQAGDITAYHHAFSFTSMLRALAEGPVIVGVNWYDSFDSPDRSGHVSIGPGAQVRGGHEFCLVGYDTATQLVTACNSWGDTWGNAGYFTVGFTDFERLLAEHGDATVPVR